jgi:hypothetical protein
VADAHLELDVDVNVHGDRDLPKLGAALGKTKDKADDLRGGTRRLSDEFEKSRTRLRDLHDQFKRTGDMDLLPNIRKEENNLKRIGGWMRALGDDTDTTSSKTKRSSTIIGDAFSSITKSAQRAAPVMANPYVLVTAAAAAAAIVVPAGAAVVGAALAGLGASFIGLGAVALRGNAQVINAFKQLGSDADKTLTQAAAGLEQPFVRAAAVMRGTVADLAPDLRASFDSVAPSVGHLAAGVDGLAKQMMPGLRNAIEASNGPLDVLSTKLPEMGAALSLMFDQMAEGSTGGAKALGTTIDLLNISLENTGRLLGFMGKTFDFLSSLPGAGREWVAVLDKMAGSTNNTARSAHELASEEAEVARRATDQLSAFINLTAAMRASSAMALTLSGTQDAITRGFQELTGKISRNHAALTGNTAVALANRDAVRSSLSDIARHGDAMVRDGANIGQVTMKRDADLRKLRDVLVARGMDKRAVEAFIATTMRVPRSVFTDVKERGAAAAAAHLRSVAVAAASIQRAINLTVGISGTAAAYATLNQLSARARAGVGGQRWGGIVEHRRGGIDYAMAGGGAIQARYARSPTVLFGERETGGEAFIPRRGDTGRSRAIATHVVREWLGGEVAWPGTLTPVAASGGGGHVTNITINVPPSGIGGAHPREVGKQIVDVLRQYRDGGGKLP